MTAPTDIDWPHINALRDAGERLASELGFQVPGSAEVVEGLPSEATT